MYTSKVYTVSIPSSGVALEEEHIARETLTQWNVENGEKTGVIFQAIPHNYKGITPDIFIFAIDNHVDVAKLEAAIKTTLPIILFFRKFHDSGNTIQTELDRVQEIRVKFQGRCTCIDYNSPKDFADTFMDMFHGYMNIVKH